MTGSTDDGDGNTLTETRPGSVSVATSYDGHGRLLSYARTGDPAQANVYNGLDDRVGVTSGSTTRAYVFDADGRMLGEYDSSAADPVVETIWLSPTVASGNAPFGGDDGTGGYAPLALVGGSGAAATLYWVHGSHLGVPLLTTNASGTTAAPTGYTAVGFPGQTRTLADLYYNRYRDYDTTTGRYIQADPIGLEGDANPYLYAGGNPLNAIDPTGLEIGNLKRLFPDLYPKPKRHIHDGGCGHPPPPPHWCGSGGANVPDGNWGEACKAHDKCYSIKGKIKEACDLKLVVDMTAVCSEKIFIPALCAVPGMTYGTSLIVLGVTPIYRPARDAYNDAQKGKR